MSDYNGQCESNDCSEWSQPSDERMDTGSESLMSTQHTPNSILSSDADDEPPADADRRTLEASTEVLRLQNPSDNTEDTANRHDSLQPSGDVLRLSEPANDNENYRDVDKFSRYRDSKYDSEDKETDSKFKSKDVHTESPLRHDDLNDSFMKKMSMLQIEDEPCRDGISRPLKLGACQPRVASQLTITSSHPLMGLSSPDGVDYPDIVPERPRRNLRIEEEGKHLSLSSIEEDKYTNGSFTDLCQYGPQRNTSKNNLYFSDNFSIAESNEISLNAATPDVARVQNGSYPPSKLIDGGTRRKIVPCFRETDHLREKTLDRSPRRVLGRPVDYSTPNLVEKAIGAYVEERNRKLECGERGEREQLPKIDVSKPLDIPAQEFDTGPAEWVESPSQLRSMTNFQLPVELSSSAVDDDECGSPDPLSTSTEERSLYRALVDPASGSVALKHTPTTQRSAAGRRRIIAVVESVDTDGEPEPQADEERLSLDSVSACSLRSEEADLPEDRGGGPAAEGTAAARGDDGSASDDDSRRNTQSDYSEPIPEYSYAEERERSEERNFRKIPLPSGGHLLCDMKVIEPYMRVLSHGGYAPHGAHIIVFSACHLPDSARKDYSYVVDNLFLYVLWTLDRLVTDEYELVYLHGSASKHRMPNFQWLKKSYQLIDRRLRKSLKHLYLVHPTFWLKSIVFMSKPFISSKFSRKLSYVHSLSELFERVRVEPAAIPQQVKDYDLGRQS